MCPVSYSCTTVLAATTLVGIAYNWAYMEICSDAVPWSDPTRIFQGLRDVQVFSLAVLQVQARQMFLGVLTFAGNIWSLSLR